MPFRTHPRRVAVIGGGISGLVTAHHLRKLDPTMEVRLFESADRLGGVIQTTRHRGFLLEGAADNFATSSKVGIELCRDLGLGNELMQPRRNRQGAMVLSHGHLEPMPVGFATAAKLPIWPIIATKILSPLGKLRGGFERLIPHKKSNECESIESFVTRRFGAEVFERLVQPLVSGIYSGNPMQLSVAAPIPRFFERDHRNPSVIRRLILNRWKTDRTDSSTDNRPFATLRGGMSRLINALGERLPEGAVQLNAEVQNVTRVGQKWHVNYRDTSTSLGDERWQADGLVVATPSTHAAKILQPVDERLARRLARIEYSSFAVVTLAFRRDQIHRTVDSFGFVVPHVENNFILSCSFSSEKYEGRAPEETVLMRVFIGGTLQPGLLRLPNNQLIELAHWEMARLLKIDGEPLMRHVVRHNHAMPKYQVGHSRRVANINECLQQLPSLALAGNSLNRIGVPGCIESGQLAAQRIIDKLLDCRATSSLQWPHVSTGRLG